MTTPYIITVTSMLKHVQTDLLKLNSTERLRHNVRASRSNSRNNAWSIRCNFPEFCEWFHFFRKKAQRFKGNDTHNSEDSPIEKLRKFSWIKGHSFYLSLQTISIVTRKRTVTYGMGAPRSNPGLRHALRDF